MLFLANKTPLQKDKSINRLVKIMPNQLTDKQRNVLKRLVGRAHQTEFGKTHHFSEIIQSDFSIEQFTRNIPLTHYEEFEQKWISQAMDGKSNVIWPGKINYFALSSGTTKDRSKYIPVTEEMLKQFHRTSVKQLLDIQKLKLPASFYKTKILIIGGSTDLIETRHFFKGDLSGILAKKKSFAFSPFVRPKKKIAKIKDWEEKKKAIISKAHKWNIGAIAGIPSWISQLLEEIVEYHQVDSIHDIWPNFRVFAHGGIFIEPFQEKLNRLTSNEIVYLNTYLASEGYFAYQRKKNGELELLTENGVFYEFIEEQYFDRIRANDLEGIPTITTKQVESNKSYAMVISTEAGLWRYIIGDIINFSDIESYSLSIVGRLNNNLNVHGEHLSEGNMQDALKMTADHLATSVEQFCVYADNKNNRHNWYIGVNKKVDTNLFSTVLDECLCQVNADYESVRRHILKRPKLKAIPLEKFDDYMKVLNKQGGQHKFPIVMNQKQATNWERFLTNMNTLD